MPFISEVSKSLKPTKLIYLTSNFSPTRDLNFCFFSKLKFNLFSHQMTLGTGSPTSLHSKMILASSSVCRMMGRSVKVGFTPALDGRGASSPKKIGFLFTDPDLLYLLYRQVSKPRNDKLN